MWRPSFLGYQPVCSVCDGWLSCWLSGNVFVLFSHICLFYFIYRRLFPCIPQSVRRSSFQGLFFTPLLTVTTYSCQNPHWKRTHLPHSSVVAIPRTLPRLRTPMHILTPLHTPLFSHTIIQFGRAHSTLPTMSHTLQTVSSVRALAHCPQQCLMP